jgi:FkbM family methyltransferase
MIDTFEKEGVLFKFKDICESNKFREWFISNFGNWESETFACFKQVANKDRICLDIGAFIGMTPIWLCKNFKHVICVEADKLSVKSLEDNLNLSDCKNFTIKHNAFFNKKTQLLFGSNNFRKCELNESMSQIKFKQTKTDDYYIETIVLSELVSGIDPLEIGLIKMDIEGGEEFVINEVVQYCSDNKIPFLLSFHIDWWTNKNIDSLLKLFSKCIIYSDKDPGVIINNLLRFLKDNPFATVFVKDYKD